MNEQDIMNKLKSDPRALKSVMQSQDGQTLLRMLSGGDSAALGKSVGKDASSGKLTYVSLYGIERTLEIRDELAGQARMALRDIPDGGFLAWELETMARRDR